MGPVYTRVSTEADGFSTTPFVASILASVQRPVRDFLPPAAPSILLLHLLAALYGSSTVASKMIDSSAVDLPPSLINLVRYGITTLAFVPALGRAAQLRQPGLLLAGCELGLQTFFGILCGTAAAKAPTGSNASLLFTFTVIVVPIMEIFAGRSVSKLTWGATLAALSAMGLLEWEGANVHDVLVPRMGDTWPLLGCALSAAHIFRSESLSARFDPLHLTAVQLGVMTFLSAGWEGWSLLTDGTHLDALSGQLEVLPWGPLLYSGLVCAGLCQWAELKGLRHVPASTATLIYTTIPLWGALLSFLLHGELPGGATTLGATVLLSAALGSQVSRGAWAAFGRGVEATEATVWPSSPWPQQARPSLKTETLPAALLSTQLKLPFYASEAQRVLGETKQAVKTALDSWGSSLLGDSTVPGAQAFAPTSPRGQSPPQDPPPGACSLRPSPANEAASSHGNSVPDTAALAHSTASSHLAPVHAFSETQAGHGVGGVADAAVHAGGLLAKSFAHAADAFGGSPLGWMAHVLARDVDTWSHILRH